MATPSSRLFLGLIPWYGVLIVLGTSLAIFLSDREASRLGLKKDTIIDLAFLVLPIGILGARIYYVIFSWPVFAEDPVSVLYLWNGGLAIFGGLIAGFAAVFFFCRHRGLSFRTVLDILIPGVALAQAIGRWGNYFNQEAYGLPLSADSPLAFFPIAVLIQSGELTEWHLAAFFYESCLDLAIFLFLLYGRRNRFRQVGDAFLFYVIFYSAGRLVIENLRMDSLYLGSSVRVSQLFSVLLCLGGLGIFALRGIRARRVSLFARCLMATELLGGITVLCVALHLPFLTALSCGKEMLFLILFFLLTVLSALVIYGRSNLSEVIYANHPPEERPVSPGASL